MDDSLKMCYLYIRTCNRNESVINKFKFKRTPARIRIHTCPYLHASGLFARAVMRATIFDTQSIMQTLIHYQVDK